MVTPLLAMKPASLSEIGPFIWLPIVDKGQDMDPKTTNPPYGSAWNTKLWLVKHHIYYGTKNINLTRKIIKCIEMCVDFQ